MGYEDMGYEEKKRYFDGLLTIYGRKPVREALDAADAEPIRLHLADSNKPTEELEDIERLARERGADIRIHERKALSRISKNGRQDQGVALDIRMPGYLPLESIGQSSSGDTGLQLIAPDRITNPQNLGLVIRSVGASPMTGLVLARQGNAGIDPLVIKAAAGTLFKARIYHCEVLADALRELKPRGFTIVGLTGEAGKSLAEWPRAGNFVFVLGNETRGLSSNIRDLCDDLVRVPLSNDIESLNVGAVATLVAFRTLFAGS